MASSSSSNAETVTPNSSSSRTQAGPSVPPPLLISPGSSAACCKAKPELPANPAEQVEALVTKHLFPEELERAVASVSREEHDKRIKNLRKELDQLEKTAWRYE